MTEKRKRDSIEENYHEKRFKKIVEQVHNNLHDEFNIITNNMFFGTFADVLKFTGLTKTNFLDIFVIQGTQNKHCEWFEDMKINCENHLFLVQKYNDNIFILGAVAVIWDKKWYAHGPQIVYIDTECTFFQTNHDIISSGRLLWCYIINRACKLYMKSPEYDKNINDIVIYLVAIPEALGYHRRMGMKNLRIDNKYIVNYIKRFTLLKADDINYKDGALDDENARHMYYVIKKEDVQKYATSLFEIFIAGIPLSSHDFKGTFSGKRKKVGRKKTKYMKRKKKNTRKKQ